MKKASETIIDVEAIDCERETAAHAADYSEAGFLKKAADCARKIGSETLVHAFELYYTMKHRNLPPKVKGMIVGALGYLVSPIDLIPDITPIIGLTDDASVLALVAGVLVSRCYVDKEITAMAEARVRQLLGPLA